MFCPKCGSEQASDNMRFCSRCGFTLGGVAELLSTDGRQHLFLPAAQPSPSLYRQIISQDGAKIVFLSVVLLPIAFLLAIPLDSTWPFLIPLIMFIIGIAQIAYTIIFGETLSFRRSKADHQFNPPEARFSLPPTHEDPVPVFEAQRGDTARMTPPPSVTESTTNLLELDKDKKY